MTLAEGSAGPTGVDDSFCGEHQLDPRFLAHQILVGRLITAAVSLALLIFVVGWTSAARRLDWSLAFMLAGWLIASLLLAQFSQRWPSIEYRHTRYRVDDAGIEIRRGVWWRQVVNVPRTRIQHTDVSQGPLERKFGLGTLVVHTAGSEYARVELPGIDHSVALRIRDYLLPRDTHDAV